MKIEFNGRAIKIKKNISKLDKFVFLFIKFLERLKIKYVVVSGYVPIFFGRTRVTEDIDILTEKINFKKFTKLFKNLTDKGFWFLNTEDIKELYDMLEEKLSIRIAEKNKVIPNIELKFCKGEIAKFSLSNSIKVKINGKSISMSPLEAQIAYKFYLGTEKDIEDAIHLYELFKDRIKLKLLGLIGKKLNVEKIMKRHGVKFEQFG